MSFTPKIPNTEPLQAGFAYWVPSKLQARVVHVKHPGRQSQASGVRERLESRRFPERSVLGEIS